jgi:hypothetical protein
LEKVEASKMLKRNNPEINNVRRSMKRIIIIKAVKKNQSNNFKRMDIISAKKSCFEKLWKWPQSKVNSINMKLEF